MARRTPQTDIFGHSVLRSFTFHVAYHYSCMIKGFGLARLGAGWSIEANKWPFPDVCALRRPRPLLPVLWPDAKLISTAAVADSAKPSSPPPLSPSPSLLCYRWSLPRSLLRRFLPEIPCLVLLHCMQSIMRRESSTYSLLVSPSNAFEEGRLRKCMRWWHWRDMQRNNSIHCWTLRRHPPLMFGFIREFSFQRPSSPPPIHVAVVLGHCSYAH